MVERLLHYFARYPLDFITHVSSSLPIIVGFFRFAYLTKSGRYIWLFFVWFFIKETYSLYLAFTTPSNLFLQNIEPIFETFFCAIIFSYSTNRVFEKRIILVLATLCILIILYSYNSQQVSATSLSSFRIFAIIVVLNYFNRLLADLQVVDITKHVTFWFSSALLLYATGTFFTTLFSQYWYQNNDKVPIDIFDKYWNINQFLFISFSVISAIGLWFSKYDLQKL